MSYIQEKNVRDETIQLLTELLPVLRAILGISQEEIAQYIGISRQTYCALELKKRQISWNTFLSLFLFFISNEKTYELLKTKKGYIAQVYGMLQYESGEKSVQYPQGFENKQ